MKQLFLSLFLICLIKVTGYNQCEFLPISLPSSSSSLISANRTIAECFAPTIHQMVDTDPMNSLGGRADLITSVFYDDQDFTNNWESLGNFTLNEILPTIYYSVVWTENYWLVTYAFYHPRDYSDTGGLCCLDNHEHDLIEEISHNAQKIINKSNSIDKLVETENSDFLSLL